MDVFSWPMGMCKAVVVKFPLETEAFAFEEFQFLTRDVDVVGPVLSV